VESSNLFEKYPTAHSTTGWYIREKVLLMQTGNDKNHRYASAVDDFDSAATPELLAGNPTLRLAGGVPMNIE